ncbi:MAG: UDP-N-acetylmuramoyl-L-alanyl-D-glutamate--2,6-diaminopimelate ligase [Candidatus Koribacter versatilis]|uniref:UDP-N-acetylmuramoyl-L-alanyl-D-glutamate--2,6-diaminopimelate ligase n=1 Tax=Candidatus Korobacter versatilis TaxID=658062 RepID=A0A932A7Z9_9BACT|nr:UDP-N-acetylmuramoyl-L-alanyl-D-glutamate--2,6-diaminopimelate ligase [Candidatus Koribacter versatilis]
MTFESLLDGVEVLSQSGGASVKGLDYDSRRVQPGWLFVAMRGETTDGNRYLDAAIKAGAVAVVTDSASEAQREGVAWAVVPHGRRALARISANFYKHPANRLKLIGITGTNGKTTTAYLVESIFSAAQRKSILVGTIEYHVAGKVEPAPHTTPEALELQQLFAQALANGATDGVMEVSSHALAQQRVYGVPFEVAVFTNLTRDHLDYHKDFDDYFAAKKLLFEGSGTEPPPFAVVNADHEYGQKLARCAKSRSQVFTYGLEAGEFRPLQLEVTGKGSRFDVETAAGKLALWTPLIGRVNVYNVLAAVATGVARGFSGKAIVEGIAALDHVPGRFQRVDEGQPFSVVVDYAHTDDALRNLTAVARDFVARDSQRGRVITLFGCGGDRDKNKRPLMGDAAGKGSDFVVLTSDNPRSEEPMAIINDALPGLRATGTRYSVEPERRKAIATALAEAKPGDIVLIAGKGHEDYQITSEGTHPFSDEQVAREALQGMGYGATPHNPASRLKPAGAK